MNLGTGKSRERKTNMGQKTGAAKIFADNYMKCARCGGAMHFERFLAFVETFHAWRCINCGEIMDPVVQKNRALINAQKRQEAG